MMKTNIAGLCLILCFTAVVSACGQVSDAIQKQGDKIGNKNEPAELVFFNINEQGVTQEEFMKDYGDSIRKRFPNYTLKNITNPKGDTTANLNQLVAAGQKFDILISSIDLTAKVLLPTGLQSDIGDLIKKNKYDLNRLEPTAIQSQKLMANNGIYGLPAYTSTTVLYYNKDLFDKFGVPYPKSGMNWDDLYGLAQKMTRMESGVQHQGLTIDMLHTLTSDALSTPWVDPATYKSQLTGANFNRAFANLVRFFQIPGNGLIDNDGLPDNIYRQGVQLKSFINNKTAAMLLGLNTWVLTQIKDQVNWDVVQIPFYPDKPGIGPQSYPTYFYISSVSNHRDAAFQVLDYITSDEFQKDEIRKGIPSTLKDAGKYMSEFGSTSPYFKGKNIKDMVPKQYAPPAAKTAYDDLVKKELSNQFIGDVANGKKDVNTALREAAEHADKAIAEARAK